MFDGMSDGMFDGMFGRWQAAMLALTAVHDVMKLEHLCPTVLALCPGGSTTHATDSELLLPARRQCAVAGRAPKSPYAYWYTHS